MVDVCYEIPKEDYDKAKNEGADSIIGNAVKYGYGVYDAKVSEVDGKYYLSYSRGDSCD